MPENIYRRGAIWHFRASIHGIEIRRSLQTGDRKLALTRASKLLDQLSRSCWGDERHAWSEAVGKWLLECSDIRASTRQRYISSLRTVAPILEPLHLDEVDRRVLQGIASRQDVTNATRRRDLTAVSAILRAAVGWGWLDSAPQFDRSYIRERRDPIVLPTDEDLERLIAKCPSMLKRMVRLLTLTGLRLEEAADLTWRQVDLERRTIIVEKTKSGRARVVPLSDEAVGTLVGTPRHSTCRYVFWHPPGVRYTSVSATFTKLRRAAGVRFRVHDLRHLFAVRYLVSFGSIYDLQRILGHSTISTTEMYLDHLSPSEVARTKSGTGAAGSDSVDNIKTKC